NEETDLKNEDYDKLIQFGSNYDFRLIEIKEINRIYLNAKQYIFDYFKEVSTKICVWDIEGYDLVGLLDADMCIIRNMDELLELDLRPIYPESTNIPPITNSESYFNSGLIILRPSKSKFNEIYNRLITHENPDQLLFPEQDLLNEIYKGNWVGLPYIYNALKTLRDCHSLMWSDKDVKNVHYITKYKPWKEDIKMRAQKLDRRESISILNNWWWKVYRDEEWDDEDFEG
ncbi:4498_t:CDS:2, partial [Racocetra fulgida]